MTDPRVQALCQEFGVEIIGKSRYPEPGQTRAVGTLKRIIDRHDMGHARAMMTLLVDTANNKASLEAEVFGATSDLIRACSRWYEDDATKFLEVFDACPIGELQAIAHDLRGFAPLRPALAGLIYERIWRAYGPRSIQPDLFDDRRVNS